MAVYNSTTHEIASNSLTSGLVFATYLEDSNTDPVLGTEAKDNSAGASADGWVQSGADVLSYDRPTGLNHVNGTIIQMFYAASSDVAATYGKFAILNDTELQVQRSAGDSNVRISVQGSQYTYNGIGTDLWNNAENQIAARWENRDTQRLSINSTHLTAGTPGQWPDTAFTFPTLNFGNRAVSEGADRAIGGRFRYIFAWDRSLSDAEIDAVLADPYQLIQPISAGPSITNINGNNTVQAGQTVTVNGTSFGANGNVTAATLGGEPLTVNSNTDTTASITIPAGIVLDWGSTTNQLVLVVGGSNYSLNGVTLSAEAGWDYIDFASAPALSGNPAEPGSIYEALTNYAPLSNYTMLAGDQLAFEDHERLTMNADTTFVLGSVDPAQNISIQAKVWKDATSEWTPEFTIQINDLGVPDVGDGGDSGGDTTAPTLSSITAYKTGFVSGFVSYNTNENNGTDYVYVSTNATETAATVKASGVQGTVTAVGLRSLILSGLSPETTYYVHVVHTDAAGNDSNVLSSSSFTTDAIPTVSDTPSSNRKLILRQVKIKTKKVTKKAVLSRIY